MIKKKINRNIIWTETFVRELVSVGVKYACISPGSRNTPLTLAFANNQNIKKFVNIDERSNGFFALGLAMSSKTPVVLVCTSGTATAEFYPAIIEAYQQRVPLIVCTADRPPELLDCGANQTINQTNIYKNHIRWFFDVGLPSPSVRGIKHIKAIARRAIYESTIRSKGPVHLNFPFRKPFEPESYTDEVENDILELSNSVLNNKNEFFREEEKNLMSGKWFKKIINHLKNKSKGLMIVGPEVYNHNFLEKCQALSQKLGYPVLADGASQLRFGKHDKGNLITNFDGFLRSDSFSKKYQPDLILHFGRTITSKALDTYLEKWNAARFMINEFGDWFDPSNKSAASLACKPYVFCETTLKLLEREIIPERSANWLKIFLDTDRKVQQIKSEVIEKARFPNESRIINELLRLIPDDSQIMLSNSMPIRDFDYFASTMNKDIIIYHNRGASGIDGIISTALGIMVGNRKPTVLLIGDLAFYYDLNGLLAAKKYNIPLVIILINNNGGGIFKVLPISNYKKFFKKYFIASHNLDFKPFVEGYGGNYNLIKSWNHFRQIFPKSLAKKNFSVLEIKTNASTSLSLRKKFWNEIEKHNSNYFLKNI